MTKKRIIDESDEPAKKVAKKEESELDGLKFKLQLKDNSLALEGITKFIELVQCMNDGETQCDIVVEYLRASDDCSELLQLLEGEEKKKPSELTLIFKCIHAILVRTADDLTKFTSSHAKLLAKHILTRSMHQIYFLMLSTNKTGQIRSALKLLTAIVIQDYSLARDVLMHFDFQNRNLMSLMNRRSYNDEEDIRACLISFYLSFIIHGDINIVRQFLEMKGVLNSIFSGLTTDHASLLEIMIPTLLDRVVREPGISKTLKLRVFDAGTLDNISSLYRWKGPTKWKNKDDPQGVESEDLLAEKRRTIGSLVHELMLDLCCSHKNGINFHDKTLGLSGKNHNPVLSTFLSAKKLPDGLDSNLQDLLINILVTCPDLIGRYLTIVQHEFTPRFTKQYVEKMDFLLKLYQHLPSISPILSMSKSSTLTSDLIPAVMVTLTPPIINSIVHAAKDKSNGNIRHVALRHLNLILERLSALEDYCRKHYPSSCEVFISACKEMFVKSLPDLRSIASCWYFLMNPRSEKKKKNSGNEKNAQSEISVHQAPAYSNMAMYSRVLVTLGHYLRLFSDYYPDHQNVDLQMIIDGVQQCTETSSKDSELDSSLESAGLECDEELYQGLLDVLASSDGRKIPWGKRNKAGNSLIYQVLNMATLTAHDKQLNHGTIELICKLLSTTGLFDQNKSELKLWLKHLPALAKQENRHSVLTFLDKVLTVLMANAQTYFDQVADVISGLDGEEKDDVTMDTEDVAMDTDDVAMDTDDDDTEVKISAEASAILSQDLNDLLLQVRTTYQPSTNVPRGDLAESCYTEYRTSVSALVPASLKVLSQRDDKKEIQPFLLQVLHDILYSQTDVRLLLALILKYPDAFEQNDFVEYIQSFEAVPPLKSKSSKGPNRNSSFHQSLRFYWQNGVTSLTDDDVITRLKQTIPECSGSDHIISNNQSEKMIVDHVSADSQSESLMVNHVMLCLKGISKTSFKPNTTKKIVTSLIALLRHICSVSSHDLDLYIQILRHPFTKEYFLSNFDSAAVFRQHLNVELANFLADSSEKCHGGIRDHFEVYSLRILEFHAENKELVEKLLTFLKIEQVTKLTETDNPVILQSIASFLVDHSKEFTFTFDFISKAFHSWINEDSLTILSKLIESTQMVALFIDKKFLQILLGTFGNIKGREECLSVITLTNLLASLLMYNHKLRGSIGKWLKKQTTNLVLLPAARAYVNTMNAKESQSDFAKKFLPLLLEKFWEGTLGQQELDTLCDFCNILDASDLEILVNEFHNKLVTMKELADYSVTFIRSLLALTKLDESGCTVTAVLLKSVFAISGKLSSEKVECLLDSVAVKLDLTEMDEDNKTLIQTTIRMSFSWKKILRLLLKRHFTLPSALRTIERLALIIYANEHTNEGLGLVSVKECHVMVTSHSMFMETLMFETTNDLKGALVSLLVTLCGLDPSSCCHHSLLPVLLGAYNASLHVTDQKILMLVALHESNGVETGQYRPYLWGSSGLDYITMRKNLGATLSNTATGDRVLALLDGDLMKKSWLKFPLQRKLLTDVVETMKMNEPETEKLYDPRFLMPIFNYILRSDSVLRCRDFIERGCLSYLMASLSSHDPHMRSVAYSNVGRLLVKLDGAKFRERELMLNFLDLVKNSLREANIRLPVITTTFLARTSMLILDPDDHVYSVINSFLLLKPTLDTGDVPEFYKLFNSSTFEHKTERGWMLELLADGLREVDEYVIFQRRQTFTLIMSFHDSTISDERAKCDIIKVMLSAVSVPAIAQRLVKSHGLLPWITAAVKSSPSEKHLKLVTEVTSRLWPSMSEVKEKKVPLLFTTSMLRICTDLVHKISDDASLAPVTKTIASVLQYLENRHNGVADLSHQAKTQTISERTVEKLLKGQRDELNGDDELVNLDLFLIVTHLDYFEAESVARSSLSFTLKTLKNPSGVNDLSMILRFVRLLKVVSGKESKTFISNVIYGLEGEINAVFCRREFELDQETRSTFIECLCTLMPQFTNLYNIDENSLKSLKVKTPKKIKKEKI